MWHLVIWLSGHSVFGQRLDAVILKVFSNLNYSIILFYVISDELWLISVSQVVNPVSVHVSQTARQPEESSHFLVLCALCMFL